MSASLDVPSNINYKDQGLTLEELHDGQRLVHGVTETETGTHTLPSSVAMVNAIPVPLESLPPQQPQQPTGPQALAPSTILSGYPSAQETSSGRGGIIEG